MQNERLIFLTNDDGYMSKGFRAAIEVARSFGHVIAIAPDRVQSGMSQAITISTPLFLRQVESTDEVEIYSFSGTPVDCVKVAFDHFLQERKIDLVLSGINHGSNAAVNVMYSGTMGAAIEGSFYGIPAVGLSLEDPPGRDYFWLTGKFNNAEPDAEDSDEWALAHGYVAVVPVQADMTDYRMLSALPDILP